MENTAKIGYVLISTYWNVNEYKIDYHEFGM